MGRENIGENCGRLEGAIRGSARPREEDLQISEVDMEVFTFLDSQGGEKSNFYCVVSDISLNLLVTLIKVL